MPNKQILLQTRKNDATCRTINKTGAKTTAKDRAFAFMSSIIVGRIAENAEKMKDYQIIKTGVLPGEMGEDVDALAQDYVRMCKMKKEKVRLDICSQRHLEKVHNRTNRDYEMTGEVSVPKKSVFLGLREILPDKFEWITDRKRLIMESKMQHHCVWSYAEDITKDLCAIYSYVDYEGKFSDSRKPRRYTIEFNRVNWISSLYCINQIKGSCNSTDGTAKLSEWIKTLLLENSREQKGEAS